MRTLLWTEYGGPFIGGSERFAANLIAGLQRLGHGFDIVCNRVGQVAPEQYGTATHTFPFRQALGNRDIEAVAGIHRGLADLVRQCRPDLVHVIALGPGDIFLQRLRETIPHRCLVTLHQYLPPPLLEPSAAPGRTLRAADAVVACSAAVQAELLQHVPEVRGRSSVIYNALPVPDVVPKDPVFVPPRLLCLGRLVEDKGFDVAIEAFSRLLPHAPQAQLIVAGDGTERQALQNLAAARGVDGQVTFTGWVHPDDTAELIGSASVVLMPSRREPFGLVALECALVGRPIVAARVDGLPEVVEDGRTGMLVDVDDISQTVAALLALLNDTPRAVAMGRQARLRAQERFRFDDHIHSYDRLYRQLGRRAPH